MKENEKIIESTDIEKDKIIEEEHIDKSVKKKIKQDKRQQKKEVKKIRKNERKEKFKNNKKRIIIISSIVIGIFLLLCLYNFLFVPKIVLNGNSYEKIVLNDEYVDKGYICKNVFFDMSNLSVIEGEVDTSKVGKYNIVYSIKQGPFTIKKTRIVEVYDDIAPVIELTGDKKLTICPNKEYQELGYTATDNYDGDITSKVIVDITDTLITYKVKDSSNNEVTEQREIKKEDKTSPVISLNGSNTIYITKGSNYNDAGVTVKDNCDDDLSSKVEKNGSVNTNSTGTYTITYTVTDSSNNKSSVTRKVIVYNKAIDVSTGGKKGVIYLTFDDGPSSSITPGILKILKQKNVKATFFVINHSSSLDYLIKQEYNEGHTVALHSYTHNYSKIYSNKDNYFNDLDQIANKVKKLTGVDSKIIRFPGGSSNTVSRSYSKGIMSYLTNEVISRGYHYFDWNVGSGDAGDVSTKEGVYKNVTKGLSKKRSNVVLMHDFENNYKTLNALSDIIDYGINNGYIFEAIDMSTPLVIHGVNN